MSRRLTAEFLGTFWLVLCGCGAAVLPAYAGGGGSGILAIALAFGLTVTTMAYAVGSISGAHFNPAVTIGLAAAGKVERALVLPYVITQTLGGIAAALVLYFIASGSPGYNPATNLAANGYGAHSPGAYSWAAGFSAELILTAGFVLVIATVTSQRSLRAFAPLVIGLTLTLANLVCIPVTNASINPARSTGPAVIMGGWALAQLWLFWLAPVMGGIAGGALARGIMAADRLAWGTAPGETGDLETTAEAASQKSAGNY